MIRLDAAWPVMAASGCTELDQTVSREHTQNTCGGIPDAPIRAAGEGSGFRWSPKTSSVLMKDDITAQLGQPEADTTVLAPTRTGNRIPGHPILGSILHPCDTVPVRIVDPHARPSREDDRQIAR